MESYVIRIYRRATASPEVVGVVEAIDQNLVRKFHTLEELVEILTDKEHAAVKPEAKNKFE